mmetsp:Transcript_57869/g.152225  ORF Transcript_57869/g.152225 Transcript_57869/m.152225 type:complete len:85 (-) Transcript_57869:104-358(-)
MTAILLRSVAAASIFFLLIHYEILQCSGVMDVPRKERIEKNNLPVSFQFRDQLIEHTKQTNVRHDSDSASLSRCSKYFFPPYSL